MRRSIRHCLRSRRLEAYYTGSQDQPETVILGEREKEVLGLAKEEGTV